MTSVQTGTREEWLAARLDLLEAEKELTRRGDEVAQRRRELPWVRVDLILILRSVRKGASRRTLGCCAARNRWALPGGN